MAKKTITEITEETNFAPIISHCPMNNNEVAWLPCQMDPESKKVDNYRCSYSGMYNCRDCTGHNYYEAKTKS